MAAPTNLVHLVVCRLCDSEVTVWDDVLNTALNVSLRPIEYRIMRTISNMGDHAIIYGDLSDVMDGNNAPGLEQEDDQLHPQAPLRDQAVGGRHGQVRAGARDVLLDDVQGHVDRRLLARARGPTREDLRDDDRIYERNRGLVALQNPDRGPQLDRLDGQLHALNMSPSAPGP